MSYKNTIKKIYWLNIGKNGTFKKTQKLYTSASDIDNMINYIQVEGKSRIAIYAHGGLNSEKVGYKSAETWFNQLKNTNTHPLGIVWESGFLDSINTQLKDDTAKLIRNISTNISNNTTENSIQNLRKSKIVTFLKNIRTVKTKLKDYNKLTKFNNKFNKLSYVRLASVLFKVVKRYKNKTNHTLIATIEEEILKATGINKYIKYSWDGMKTKASDMFKDNSKYAGTYLLQKLAKYQRDNPSFEIDLIGHSAGSIVHNNLLMFAKTKFPNLKFNNVTYLAPACTMDLFYEGTVRQKTNIKKIRIFTMKDKLEKKDHVGYIYRSSLLYLVSGTLEENIDEAILGLQRHITKKLPHHTLEDKKVQKFIKNTNSTKFEIFYSKTNKVEDEYRGKRTTATKHGDFFPEDDMTLKSITYISTH